MDIKQERIALYYKIAPDGNISGKRATQAFLEKHGYWNSLMKLTSEFDVNIKTRLGILKYGDTGRCGVCGCHTKYIDGKFKKYCPEHAHADKMGKPAHNRKESDEQRIIDCYNSGMSAMTISKQDWCNVSHVTVQNILKRNGVDIKSISEILLQKRKEIPVDEIRDYYHNSNIAKTASHFGVPAYRVREVVETHNHSISCKNSYYQYEEESKEWNKMYQQGMRTTEIAKEYNVSPFTVRRVIDKLPREHLKGSQKCNHPIDFTGIEQHYKDGVSIDKLAEYYDCNKSTIYDKLTSLGLRTRHDKTSNPERVMQAILDKHNIDYIAHDRTQIKPKELDIFIPDYNLAIEVNGLYWHSTSIPKVDTRHIDKFMECKSSGIKLLQFADSMIHNKLELVESMILSKLGKLPNKIMARKCKIVNLNITQANHLFEQWHYQGRTTNGAKCLGLMHDNKIVAALAYTIKDNECRIERFACELMANVVGGYSKLESEVLRQHNVTQLTTFSLGLISDGSLYSNNGYTTPGYSTKPEFYVTDGETLYNRQRFMKTKMTKLFGNGFNPDKTEWENICDNGLLLFFGAGITKWVKQL